ncbi:putative Ig domain-containing protein [Corallococcus sp. M34]|uniref:putative Ig domain-containing protein n=1 Tax=Citreicoccus inhibens TaxID=2849499 RepID=UPI001C2320C2|nr:putative Ig domain-containing protein [Citreicoccus inhibens]MBU8896932.1 putative Ig domain-containing protein [Citreicoccus inhibens]
MSPRRVLGLLLVVWVSACSEPEPPKPPDGPGQTDAGHPPVVDAGSDGGARDDAGTPVDAGPDDAGSPVDAGTSDAGPDGGSTVDAGTSDGGATIDAGHEGGANDAGTSDGGAASDAGHGGGSPDAGATDAGAWDPLTVTTASPVDGYVGRSYSAELSASGGVAPYSWQLASGALPSGLVLGSAGTLSGQPEVTGSFEFVLEAVDAVGARAQGALHMTVHAPPVLSAVAPQQGYVGDVVSRTFVVSGGKAPWAFTSVGILPAGLTLSTHGELQGSLSQVGASSFEVRVSDGNEVSDTLTVSFDVVAPPQVSSQSLPSGAVGKSYQGVLSATGGRAPLTWAFSGALPTGLSLSASGVLSGTPTTVGTSTFTVSVVDAGNRTDSRGVSVTIQSAGAQLFTVGQWNLEYFGDATQGPIHSSSGGGTSDDLQIAAARDVLRDTRANLWGLVEMVDTADFDALKAQVPGMQGFLANNPAFVPGGATWYSTNEQKPGVLYDNTLTFVSAGIILTEYNTDFSGRPPLRVDFTTPLDGVESPLVVIVLHMKALDDATSRDARQRASVALKGYLDANLAGARVLVLGDWNDDVDESISHDGAGNVLPTPYANFVEDPAHYTFVTRPLSLAGQRSVIGFEGVVDHTLITESLAARYVANSARILAPDQWIPDYENVVSDHYPVVSAYALSGQSGPSLRLKQPQGGTYQGGSTVAVVWAAWDVADVRVEASLDGGSTWGVLAASVPAEEGRYLWTLPNADLSNVWVRVVDVSSPSRVAVSASPLAVVSGPARVFINEYLANEPIVDGGTQGDPDYEFVELVNGSPFAVDLSGWSVWDKQLSRHVFAQDTVLGPGLSFVVYGGARGVPPGAVRSVPASTKTLGLNNGGDTVELKMRDGGSVDKVDYTSSVRAVSDNRDPDGTRDGGFVRHTALNPDLNASPGLRADGGVF